MKIYKLRILIDEDRVIHETVVGYGELEKRMERLLTRGIKIDLSSNSSVWHPTHRIRKIFIEEEKDEE